MLVNVVLGEGLVLDELFGVFLNGGPLVSNALVHQRLGEGRLVGLVVSLLAVADNVDDNILLELGTPVSGKLADEVDGLDIVTVDVENGSVNGLCNVGTVGGRTREAGVGGETDLVVDYNVDGTAGVVRGEGVEAHGLVDDTLAGESGITVQENTHGSLGFLLVVVVVEKSSGLSEHDRVLSFQVGGVGNEGELDTLAGWGGSLKVHTKMVLDVSGTFIRRLGRTTELAENGLVGLADDVGKDVETTTVGHTDDNILDTVVDTAINQSLHTGNQRLSTLQTETLVVGVLGCEEALEAGTPDEAVQDSALLVYRVLVGVGDFDALAQPVTLLSVRNVNVLDTVAAAVKSLAGSNDVLELHLVLALSLESRQDTGAKRELLLHVGLGELVRFEVELSWVAISELAGLVADAQGIDLGLVVTA